MTAENYVVARLLRHTFIIWERLVLSFAKESPEIYFRDRDRGIRGGKRHRDKRLWFNSSTTEKSAKGKRVQRRFIRYAIN